MPDVDTIFSEAIEITQESARSAFLMQACGANAALRQRVDALLAAHFAADGFLEVPIAGSDRVLIDVMSSVTSQETEIGTFIGHYKLQEKIGVGGMGAVYVAEQTRPVQRRVALKLIRPGMDSAEVVARFNAERQALAMMDHPNIARVLDAGTAEIGRPYFVMELVRGLPITEYCDQARLTAAKRLRLFVQVCRAVQHAHQKGIIHRDIKPNNVMVTLHDNEPVPKVIDFGIAKAMNHQFTDGAAYTRLTQLVGTPMYMSPEQAELNGLDIDTRSDVYSLGVLLYELLAGVTPFDEASWQKAGFDEMRRMIREDDPPKPSCRISTLNATSRSTVTAQRGLDERQLVRMLRGDLDWITMKALEKDRNRRYESAGAFAADVERFLGNEPVEARPPSVGYRLRKFAQRHRAVLSMTAIVGLAILSVVGSLGWRIWDRATHRAAAEQAASEALSASAEHYLANRPEAAMAEALRAANTLEIVPGSEEMLAKARLRIADLEMARRLEEAWLGGVDVELTTTEPNKWLYAAFRGYGLDPIELDEAQLIDRIRGSLIADELLGGLDGWASSLRKRNGIKDPMATKFLRVADAADSDAESRRLRNVAYYGTIDEIAKLAAEIPVAEVSQSALERLARPLVQAGHHAAAEELLRRGVRAHPENVRHLFGLAELLRLSPEEAKRIEALGYYRAALALRPESNGIRQSIGICLTNFLNRPAEGAEYFREILRRQPQNVLAISNLVIALNNQGKLAEAEGAARIAVAVSPSIITYHRLANQLNRLGKNEEAKTAFQTAIKLQPQTAVEFHSQGLSFAGLGRRAEAIAAYQKAIHLNPWRADVNYDLGNELMKAGKTDEALAAFRQAISFRPGHAPSHNAIANIYLRRGRADDALIEIHEAMRYSPKNELLRYTSALAMDRMGRLEESINEFREAIRLKPSFAEAHFSLGAVLDKAERIDEAIGAYRQAIHHKPDHAEAHCNLGQIYRRSEQFTEALEYYRRGHQFGIQDPKWSYPSARWVEEARRLVELQPRLTHILDGIDTPTDPLDLFVVAVVAAHRRQYLRSADLYDTALTNAARISDGEIQGRRFAASRSAIMAAFGQGIDGVNIDSQKSSALRRQALNWLRMELAHWEQRIPNANQNTRSMVQNQLRNWESQSDLSRVRHHESLAKLPDDEREAWTRFWADVKAVQDRVRQPQRNP